MNLPGFSVNRPVFTTMMVLIVLLLGSISLTRLPIDLMPDVEYPTLSVSVSYANAAPEEVEELITRVIEEAVAAVPGIEEITSTSSEGNSSVRLSFVWGTDLDAAANEVRARLDRVLGRLPDDASRPSLWKFDPSSFPIIIFGVISRLDPIELRTVLDTEVQNRLERIPGVAAIDIWGGLQREIRIEADADRINALGLTLDRVLDSIREANITIPAGEIQDGELKITLRTPGLLQTVDQINEIVVANRDGAPVYLEQVAEVHNTHQEVTRLVRINGEPGVRMAVRKQSGTNTVEVARTVLSEIDRINRDFSQFELIPMVDTSVYIQRSIDNIARSILLGGSLAVLVLLFFLRNIRSTLVIATAIPVSIIATFGLVYYGGFTLNIMTLGGLALGVGMMVDNAIVVLENIFRLRENRMNRREAAVRGAREVSSAILAATLTTMVIFLPIFFMEGVTGIMFRQLAYVIAFALLCSLATALTLVPMLASHLPDIRRAGDKPVRAGLPTLWRSFAMKAEAAFAKLETQYSRLLDLALRHRPTTLMAAFGLFGLVLFLLPRLGTEFMPSADEGEVQVRAEMQEGTRIEAMDEMMRRIEEMVLPLVPERENVIVNIGRPHWRGGGTTSGDIRIALVPARERSRSSSQIANELRPLLQDIPGVTVRTWASGGLWILRVGTGGGNDSDRLRVEVRGFDLETLDALAHQIQDVIEDVPGIADVRLGDESGAPQNHLIINRERAADFGLSVGRIARMLRTALGGSPAGEFRDGAGNEVPMLIRLKDADRMNIEEVMDLTIPSENGEPVSLRTLIDVEQRPGPKEIRRRNQQRYSDVSITIEERDLGSVASDVRDRLRDIPLPPRYEIHLAGDYEAQAEAFRELLISLTLALLLVYMVMACLYESLRYPLVVMFSVPMAAIGAILALYLTGSTLNVNSYIGLIMLGGIVVNNAILIVDQATRILRDGGFDLMGAVKEAGRRRLRPILMTSFTTSFALLPLALGIGEGAEAQAPLARVVIGGLLSSSLITLIIIPVVYTLFHSVKVPLKDDHRVSDSGTDGE